MRRKINENNDIPQTIRVSPKLANGLSEYRKAVLEEDINNGIIKEASTYNGSTLNKNMIEPPPTDYNGKIRKGEWVADISGGQRGMKTGATNKSGMAGTVSVVHSAEYKRNLEKQAACAVSSGGGSGSNRGGVDRLAPEVYSPLFTMANLNLPRDRITVTAWCRNFYLLHPIVRNAITLHATYPISKINLKCPDRKVLQFFEDMIEEMDLMSSLGDISLEYWKIGECIPYAELDESTKKWKKIVIQNPDFVSIKKSVLASEPIISLRPDTVLQRLVMSNAPADVQIRQQIDEKIIHYVRTGQDIPLDNFNVSHLKMLAAPYDVRGTSIIVSVFKDLMLYDKLMECKYAQADTLVNPLTIIKVGGNTDGEYRATQEDLESYREILESAEYDKSFKLVTHAGVSIERVGASGAVLEVTEDLNRIIKNIYTGLMVPISLVDSEGASYAQASVGLEIIRQRYFNFRNMMARWLENKIFAPISELQGFYEYKDGRKRLIIPQIEWNQMNLYDLQDYIGNISSLAGSKQVSIQTLYKSLGLNYEDEQIKMRREMIDTAIRQREEQALSSLTLSELKSLDPEKEITEKIGEAPEAALPPSETGGLPTGGIGELAPPPAPEAVPGIGTPEVEGGAPPLGPGTMPTGPG